MDLPFSIIIDIPLIVKITKFINLHNKKNQIQNLNQIIFTGCSFSFDTKRISITLELIAGMKVG